MLREKTIEQFEDNLISLNNKLYIELDVLIAAIDELAFTEAILGTILLDENNTVKKDNDGILKIPDSDIYEYLNNGYNRVNIDRKDKTAIISINQ